MSFYTGVFQRLRPQIRLATLENNYFQEYLYSTKPLKWLLSNRINHCQSTGSDQFIVRFHLLKWKMVLRMKLVLQDKNCVTIVPTFSLCI